jgi:2-dehydro-3-deoxygluconokinase
MRLSIAGSESNVAIGVSRLGHSAVFVGRTGADSLGAMVRTSLLGAGVTGCLSVDPNRPTGLMLVERRMHDVHRVQYYRQGSAGGALTPDDVELATIATARVLHVTGITPLLSDDAAAAVMTAVGHARSRRVPVSIDLNYRSALASPTHFRATVGPLLEQAELVFASLDEARLLLDEPEATPEELAASLIERGPSEVVLTDGPQGAWAAVGECRYRQPALPVVAADPIGAGDAFVAGYLAARLDDRSPGDRLSLATRVAAVCVSTEGDWEGLPSADDLAMLDLEQGAVRR